MTSPELVAHAFHHFLDIVDLWRWGRKGEVFKYVAQRQLAEMGEPVGVSYRTAARDLHLDPRATDRWLKALVDDRVLVMVEAGRGRRPAVYRVNPDVDRWRNAPLRVDVELAMYRLDAVGFGRSQYLSRVPVPEPMSRATPRAVRESSAALLASSQQRLLAALQASSQPVADPTQMRDLLDTLRSLVAALEGSARGTSHASVTTPGEPSQDHGAAPAAPCSSSFASLSLDADERETVAAHRSALLTAIGLATGGGALWGAPADRAGGLLAVAPLEELEAWCEAERARPRSRPLTALGLLAILEARAAGAGQSEVRRAPERLVANLRSQVLTFVADGDAETARARLDELQQADPAAAAALVDDHPELGELVGA